MRTPQSYSNLFDHTRYVWELEAVYINPEDGLSYWEAEAWHELQKWAQLKYPREHDWEDIFPSEEEQWICHRTRNW